MECIFAVFAAVYNFLVFGLLINNIRKVLDNIDKKSSSTKKELKLIDRYMTKKKINQGLSTRILHYLSYTNEI